MNIAYYYFFLILSSISFTRGIVKLILIPIVNHKYTKQNKIFKIIEEGRFIKMFKNVEIKNMIIPNINEFFINIKIILLLIFI